jgi:cell envelope opacity-associated protein A
VTARTRIRKERRLPIAGRVVVARGALVRAEDVVAQAELPGEVHTVNVVNQLGIPPAELASFMLKQEGDAVARHEVIAKTRSWLKWFRSQARSPIDGTIETVSPVTGQVLIRTAPRPVTVRAYVDGTVVEVEEREGVVVETTGAFVQGIFGVGGEVSGVLAMVGGGPDAVIGPADLTGEHADKIVVAGALVTSEVYERAADLGLAALVCGGFHDRDLRRLLGYDLGVAITGHEVIRPILIMTEGFGRIAMANATFELLAAHVGERASANGATQIRAGVLRPEIIVPMGGQAAAEAAPEVVVAGLTAGSRVRIIREPGFGRLGVVKSLPAGLQAIETEAKVRVVEVAFPDGSSAVVPRANVEAIES